MVKDHENGTEDHGQDNDKTYTIVVNGRPREFTGREITFAEVVALAFESSPHGANTIFTVTYKRGQGNKPEGSMVEGDSVKVKEGMVFNATATDKS